MASDTRLWFPTKLLDKIPQTIYKIRANAQTYHFKTFWIHLEVILDPQITKNKVGPVLLDTLYFAYVRLLCRASRSCTCTCAAWRREGSPG